MTRMSPILALAALLALALPGGALGGAPGGEFSFSFDWSDLAPCTSGYPNRVKNPAFVLKHVPPGTKFVRFQLRDLDVPGYNHGGGLVPYQGRSRIEPGAFTYNSPCPPDGSHRYRWTATALKSRSGGVLATASAERDYP